MKEKRDASIELLRIFLMCTIPIYHLMLYNGVLYVDYHANTILGIVFASGAIPADYAFMAISAYYLQEKNVTWNQKHIKRILNFTILLAVLYVVRFTVLRGLFGFHNTKYFVDLFLMTGAWWYAWGFACDLIAFSWVYFAMGLLRKQSGKKRFGIKVTTSKLFLFSAVLYLCMTLLCIEARIPQSIFPVEVGMELTKRLMGRYSLPAAILGIVLFFAVREIQIQPRLWITVLADTTMYVFLLHDTVMGVFWYFGKCWNDFSYYSREAFCGWMMIYLAACYLVALLFQKIYQWGQRQCVKKRTDTFERVGNERNEKKNAE